MRTSLSAGAANNAEAERLELEQALPSKQKTEEDLKREYKEYKTYTQQRLEDAYGNIVAQIADILTQQDPLDDIRRLHDPEHAGHYEEGLVSALYEYNNAALWLALRLPEATTKRDVERHFREMYGSRPQIKRRRNRSKRMAIASSIWEVWQAVREGTT